MNKEENVLVEKLKMSNEIFDWLNSIEDELSAVEKKRERLYERSIRNPLGFNSLSEAIDYLDKKYIDSWLEECFLEMIYIRGISVCVSEGLRFDPLTDEEYKLYNVYRDLSESRINVRLS